MIIIMINKNNNNDNNNNYNNSNFYYIIIKIIHYYYFYYYYCYFYNKENHHQHHHHLHLLLLFFLTISLNLLHPRFNFYFSNIFRYNHSYWDVKTARFFALFIKVFVSLQFLSNLLLLTIFCKYGSPIIIGPFADYGNGDSYTYGISRPLISIILISFGILCEMSIYPRIICIIGSFQQIIFDAFSAFQVGEFINQQSKIIDSVTGNYSFYFLRVIYWRDVVSIASCILIVLYCFHFSTIVGWVPDFSFISYRSLGHIELNRSAVMRLELKSHFSRNV